MLSEAAFNIICVTSSRSFSDGMYLIAFNTFCNSLSVKYPYSDRRYFILPRPYSYEYYVLFSKLFSSLFLDNCSFNAVHPA